MNQEEINRQRIVQRKKQRAKRRRLLRLLQVLEVAAVMAIAVIFLKNPLKELLTEKTPNTQQQTELTPTEKIKQDETENPEESPTPFIDEGTTTSVGVQTGIQSTISKYSVSYPKTWTKEEISVRLLELAAQYPEFAEISNHKEDYPEDLLAALCGNPNMIDFVSGYLTADKSVVGAFTQEELEQTMPLLLQWDSRWGYFSYGEGIVGISGCGPTCLSMVVVSLTGNADATPAAIAEYAVKEGYYVPGVGTAWSLMKDGGSSWGVKAKELSLQKSKVFAALEAGQPIVCSMRPGDFTSEGHFIVLYATEDGKIKVNDPNSRERSAALWDYETLERQIKNLWAFSKAD